ncbi:HAD family hydrolase [Burkholderia ubonensis]|uniref:HAD family hydrolase n=1 Tax=Burkholderia ubonensis TaxID=101571 RepID=UPI000752F2FB|nr:HAD family phosphatase [Burkholderia ubonensis]KVS39910.1 HAD family hydrolase [Burkholderia ubonensis]KVS48005.1 HAD family hydrolase [Burkholderia ubonensis]KVS78739.1 HAD family hydrolase [Burkholderia ubonensis]KVS93460.1 HAD family hydrolase [Burkholderia ubonensis]KVS94205.1 HAD family hydrolase [Burkholderia ubonensis]
MRLEGIHALICDCDGVLIDSEAIAGPTLVRELEARWPGADVESVVTPLLGVQTERLLLHVAALLGRTLAPEDIAAIHETVQKATRLAPMVDGVDEALAAIPLVKACASNSTSRYVKQVLSRTGLERLFHSGPFTADMVPHPKPAPDVYLMAAWNLAVDPKNCLVVEDSVAGATAAVAAGMTVLGFTGGAHDQASQALRLHEVGAGHTFDQMSQLPALVEAWINESNLSRPGTAGKRRGDFG